jgi:hypothetical protein
MELQNLCSEDLVSFKQCIGCNNGMCLQLFCIAICFVVLRVKVFVFWRVSPPLADETCFHSSGDIKSKQPAVGLLKIHT